MDAKGVHVKLAFANTVTIHDISLGGISLKTDRRINIGKEYHLKLVYKKSVITAKGIAVWSLLGNSHADAKGNVVPEYSCGLKFTNDTKEQIKNFIALIEENSKKADKQSGINDQAGESIDPSAELKEVLGVFT